MSLVTPGRRLVVAGQHGLDGVVLVLGQNARVVLDRDALAPFHVETHDLEAQALAHVGPQVGELSERRAQDLVAGVKGIGQSRFPAAGTRGGKDQRLAGRGLEHLLEVFQKPKRERAEVGRAHVFQVQGHRLHDALGDVRGTGNKKPVVASLHLFPPVARRNCTGVLLPPNSSVT